MLNTTLSLDWAPTVKLGCLKGKPILEASQLREDRIKSRDSEHRRSDGVGALLDLHESAEDPESEDITEILHVRQGNRIVLRGVAGILDYRIIRQT